jgi:hypothetical protein
MLEFGESSTVESPLVLLNILHGLVPASDFMIASSDIARALESKATYARYFGSARAIYKALFNPSVYVAVDGDPGPRRIIADLNRPLRLGQQFDTCINNGTSEHVFDQANFYEIMHNHTRPGGLMIHWTPGIGWVDHGMFSAQPGYFFDLARANNYEIKCVMLANTTAAVQIFSGSDYARAVGQAPSLSEALLCVALVKSDNRPFVAPMQGMFNDVLTNIFSLAGTSNSERWPPTGVNIARNSQSTQSSTSIYSTSDDPTVDASGGNNGIVSGTYGFHTDLEDEPWWRVDFGEMRKIGRIHIFNRIDSVEMSNRARSISVQISSEGTVWSELELPTLSADRCFGGADGRFLQINLLPALDARYLKIALRERNYLHLDEVEVYEA